MNDVLAEEQNDKLRLGATRHPHHVAPPVVAQSQEESDGVMLSAILLIMGVLGVGALAGLLGCIFIFSPFWVH